MSGSSPPASPLVQHTSQPVEPWSIQAAAVAAGPKSASSGWAAMTMNRAGRQVCGPVFSAVMWPGPAGRSRGASGAFLAQCLEHLGGVAVGLDLRPGPGDAAVGIDQEGGADDAHVRPPERGLLAPAAVAVDHRPVGIRQKRERQRELLPEPAMAGCAVLAHAPDVGIGRRVVDVEVAELAGLGVAAWRVVLGVEVEHGPAAL